MRTLIPGVYRHYKGRYYRSIGVAKHSETLEDLVVYIPLYENPVAGLWVRPLEMFLEEVEVDGRKRARFEMTDAEENVSDRAALSD